MQLWAMSGRDRSDGRGEGCWNWTALVSSSRRRWVILPAGGYLALCGSSIGLGGEGKKKKESGRGKGLCDDVLEGERP